MLRASVPVQSSEDDFRKMLLLERKKCIGRNLYETVLTSRTFQNKDKFRNISREPFYEDCTNTNALTILTTAPVIFFVSAFQMIKNDISFLLDDTLTVIIEMNLELLLITELLATHWFLYQLRHLNARLQTIICNRHHPFPKAWK